MSHDGQHREQALNQREYLNFADARGGASAEGGGSKEVRVQAEGDRGEEHEAA